MARIRALVSCTSRRSIWMRWRQSRPEVGRPSREPRHRRSRTASSRSSRNSADGPGPRARVLGASSNWGQSPVGWMAGAPRQDAACAMSVAAAAGTPGRRGDALHLGRPRARCPQCRGAWRTHAAGGLDSDVEIRHQLPAALPRARPPSAAPTGGDGRGGSVPSSRPPGAAASPCRLPEVAAVIDAVRDTRRTD